MITLKRNYSTYMMSIGTILLSLLIGCSSSKDKSNSTLKNTSAGLYSGHPCSDILVHGIMDRVEINVKNTKYALAKSYFCKHSTSQIKKSSSGSLGAVYKSITGNASYNNNKHKSWQKSHCSSEEREVRAEDFQFHAVSELVNDTGINAWKECMKSRNNHIIAYRTKVYNNTYKVNIEWSGRGNAKMSYQEHNIKFISKPVTEIFTHDTDNFEVEVIDPNQYASLKVQVSNPHSSPNMIVTFTEPPREVIIKKPFKKENTFLRAIDTGIRNQAWDNNPLIGDVNGDGKDDLVLADKNVWNIAFGNENGFSHPISTGLNNRAWDNNPLLGDVNGDGKADLVLADNNVWNIAFSNGSGFEKQRSTGLNNRAWDNNPLLGDVNGDGKADLVLADNNVWNVAFSNGSGFEKQRSTGLNNRAWDNNPLLGDVNGDGKADLVLADNNVWNVAFSNGSGFEKQRSTGLSNRAWKDGPLLGDVNGDGRADLVLAEKNVWNVAFGNENGFEGYLRTQINNRGCHNNGLIGDFNGDGEADLILAYNNVWNILTSPK